MGASAYRFDHLKPSEVNDSSKAEIRRCPKRVKEFFHYPPERRALVFSMDVSPCRWISEN